MTLHACLWMFEKTWIDMVDIQDLCLILEEKGCRIHGFLLE